MKRITTAIASTAIAACVAATGAQAQSGDAVPSASTELAAMQGQLIRTRDITGGAIFTTSMADDDWTNLKVETSSSPDWNKIGEIEDVVLTPGGQMKGLVGEVGGFLDIADKHVLLATDDVKLVATDDKTYAYITRLSEEELEQLPSVDEGFWN